MNEIRTIIGYRDGRWKIVVDGQDITINVLSVGIDAEPGRPPVVTLRMLGDLVDLENPELRIQPELQIEPFGPIGHRP